MKIGTKVKMVNCYEAKKYPGKVWVTRSESWELGHGQKVVLLEGKSGGFSLDCLEIADEKGLQDVLVFQLCECDAVAAYSLDEAKSWYKAETGLTDEDLYSDEEVKIVSPDLVVRKDADSSDFITVREIVDAYWEGEPFIAISTEC